MNSVIPNFRACIIFESISYKGFGSDLFQKKKKKKVSEDPTFPQKKKKSFGGSDLSKK